MEEWKQICDLKYKNKLHEKLKKKIDKDSK